MPANSGTGQGFPTGRRSMWTCDSEAIGASARKGASGDGAIHRLALAVNGVRFGLTGRLTGRLTGLLLVSPTTVPASSGRTHSSHPDRTPIARSGQPTLPGGD